MRIPVCIKSMRDTKHLVQAAGSCEKDVDLICGRYVVNAKSMLGVFSLPRFDRIEINVDETEVTKIWVDSKIKITGGKQI